MYIFSPLEHFEIDYYTQIYSSNYDFSVTSGVLYLLSLFFYFLLFFFFLRKTAIIPSNSNLSVEYLFTFILSIFKQQIKSIRALRFFPFMFALFLFIFLLNFLSLFVYGTSLTGHILITGYLSFSIFISFFIIGLLNFGAKFFNFFVPKNVPNILLDFITFVEVFSFIIRPFSLSIRLFANMLAGHTLMGIFAQFCAFVMKHYLIFFVVPLFLVISVFILEIAVSIIQAYIFVSLVCIYLNDVTSLHD